MAYRSRSRHGCLTTWLVWMILCNSALAILSPMVASILREKMKVPWLSVVIMIVLIVLAVLQVIFAVALLKWKRWGFYALLTLSVLMAIASLVLGLGVAQAVSCLTGAALTFLVLQIGGERKAWPRLR